MFSSLRVKLLTAELSETEVVVVRKDACCGVSCGAVGPKPPGARPDPMPFC